MWWAEGWLAGPCCAPTLRSLSVALVKSHPHLPKLQETREPDRDWRGKQMREIEARALEGQKEGLGTFA